MKQLLLLTALFVIKFTNAQTNNNVVTKNGVELTYELKMLDSGTKKTKYAINISAVNKTNVALYYAVAATLNASGKLDAYTGTQFAATKINNSTALFSTIIDVKGDATNIKSDGTKLLFKIEPNRVYTASTTFNVKSTETPIVTVKFVDEIKKLEEFSIDVFAKNFVDGLWKTDCGSSNIHLTYTLQNGKIVILQMSNGKQIKWIEATPYTFVKETDVNATLIFNKQNQKFIYTSAEGISVEWYKQ